MHVGACKHIHAGINTCDVKDPGPANSNVNLLEKIGHRNKEEGFLVLIGNKAFLKQFGCFND